MKKILLFTAALLTTVFVYSQAPNTWTQKADFGGTARYAAIGFSIGSKGYLGTGTDGNSYSKDFWEYDPKANSWTQKADFGGVPRATTVGFSINNKGYIGTGWPAANVQLNDFWEYDPVSNTWSRKADFAGGIRGDAVGFSIGSKGYVGTGVSGVYPNYVYYKDFWEYDPKSDIWTKKANFGGASRYGAIGFSVNGKGYVGTGKDGASPCFKDLWEFNPLLNTWIQKAKFGGTGRFQAKGFSINNKGYVGTGIEYNGDYPKDFWEYDPDSDKWTQKNDYTGGGRSYAVGFNIGSKGYLGTGNISGNHFNDFWEYTPDVCNGLTVYADADGDGYGNEANSLFVADCIVSSGYVYDSTDCNDTNASVHPNATEIVGDGIDNNCNGAVDEAVNNALNFDGKNDYVQTSISSGSTYTLEAWIKPDLIKDMVIMGNDDDNYNGKTWVLTSSGKMYVHNCHPSSCNDIWSTKSINVGDWNHVAVSVSGGTLTFYINGVKSGGGSPVEAFGLPWWIGRGWINLFSNTYFKGDIDEVRIWNVARTQAQILSDMNSGVSGDATGLVAYYPCNQGIPGGNNAGVTTLDDITANNNDGTLDGFALNGSKSNWVAVVPDCASPSGLIVTNITGSSANLQWTKPGSFVYGYQVNYRPANAGTWVNKIRSFNFDHVVADGLSPNTTYNWKIRSLCRNDKSEWIAGPDFTTAASLTLSSTDIYGPVINKTGKTGIHIIPNPNNGNFTVQMELPKSPALTTLTLYNNTGTKVWQQVIGLLSGTVNRNIGLQARLTAGVFVLMVQHGNTGLMQKLVVNK